MSLYGPNYEVEADGRVIRVRFLARPSVAIRQAVRAHGFEKMYADPFTYTRANDHNGQCAKDYLVKRLKELYG